MVEAAGGAHHGRNRQRVVDHIGALLAGTDCHDHRLRRIDDGGEMLDAHHAHIGDGGSAALIFMRLQLAVLGFGSKCRDFGRNR